MKNKCFTFVAHRIEKVIIYLLKYNGFDLQE